MGEDLQNQRGKAAEWVSPRSLTPWESNPRNNDDAVGVVEDSIRRFGFGAPIVARKADGMVIAGHTRLRAALSLGLESVPVRFLDIDRSEAEAYALADNKVGEIAGWDDTLADVMRGMDVDLDGLGWTSEELDALLGDEGEDLLEPSESDDDAPKPDESEPVSRVGEVYELGPHRLVCGDSTDPEVLRALMGGERVDFLHADPPYGMGKEAEGVANDNLYGDKLDAFQMAWWTACRTVLRDNASAMIWGNAPDLWRLWYAGGLAMSERLSLRNEVVWDKGEASAGGVSFMGSYGLRSFPGATERALFFMLGAQSQSKAMNADDFWEGWEPIRAYLDGEREKMGWGRKDTKRITGTGMHSRWFSKSQWAFPTREHYEALQRAAREEAFKKDYEAVKKDYEAFKKDYDELHAEWMASRAFFDNTHELMTDVWQFQRAKGADRHGHATPKPVAMMVRAIRSCCPKDGIVLEPFGGSGSTLIGAAVAGRQARVVELLPRWCDVIRRRWTRWAKEHGRDPGTGALE